MTQPDESRKLILVADDDASSLEVLRSVLNVLGYQALTAGSGAEALALARTHVGRVAVLLTDVMMPQMSGPELAAALAAEQPEVHVVFMSGYDERVLRTQRQFPEGCVMLTKPLMVPELRETLRVVLGE